MLCDNRAKENFESGHGLSIFIEGEKRILFDTGPSDAFLRNSKKLKVDINNRDYIVLSHGHWDHTNGLEFIKGGKIVAHPNCFIDRINKDGKCDGPPLSLEAMGNNFDLILTKEPYKITDNMIFLGEVPRKNDFEAKKAFRFYYEGGQKRGDFMLDDSALVIKTNKGLVIVTGCSHSGICNIVEHAKKVCNENKIFAVIGGFHLKDSDTAVIDKTIEFLKKDKIEKICPCHCTGLDAIEKMKEQLNTYDIATGSVIEIDE
jgi:7,8-dihydropterin-6-yl-methyl-4-(beta-D-ribofuranosyl)aminobenzene 5'-phosphate synthase